MNCVVRVRRCCTSAAVGRCLGLASRWNLDLNCSLYLLTVSYSGEFYCRMHPPIHWCCNCLPDRHFPSLSALVRPRRRPSYLLLTCVVRRDCPRDFPVANRLYWPSYSNCHPLCLLQYRPCFCSALRTSGFANQGQHLRITPVAPACCSLKIPTRRTPWHGVVTRGFYPVLSFLFSTVVCLPRT